MLLVAAALAAVTPTARPSPPLAEVSHALAAGRLDQAGTMLATAIGAGASGDAVNRATADLAFAREDWARAAPMYARLSAQRPADALMVERAGLSALQLNDLATAVTLLDRATTLPGASWRVWSARGALADRQQAWEAADMAYARATALAPDRAEIVNNRGWSLLLRGRWREAEAALAHAAALAPASPRIADNLELARAALAADLPRRRTGEANDAWAARLNDAGVVAAVRGEQTRALAAFARAIELRAQWSRRTAANLAALEGSR